MKNKIELIDKAAVVAEIERRIKERDFQMKSGCWVSPTYMYEYLLDFLDTLEVKEVDLEKELDLEKEFDEYTKDIMAYDVKSEPFTHLYNCAKHFFEFGIKAQKGEIYIVTRSEEHADYVEAVFLNKDKAEEYCKPFNEDEDSYGRNITKIKIL